VAFGDWSPNGSSLIAQNFVPSLVTTSTTDDGILLNAVANTLGAVQYYGSAYLDGIGRYTPQNVFEWAATQHTPNGPHSITGALFWHGNWCGAGGSGVPVDTEDAACLVHDFLYEQYGFTPGSNYDGYNSGLQAINQGLCDTAGSSLISGYFNFGIQTFNLDPQNLNNPSCK
jgi:hypothetical protein